PLEFMPSLQSGGPTDITSMGNWGGLASGFQPQSQGMFGGMSNWMNDSGFLGKTLGDGTKVQGWGAPAMGAVSGLASSFLGMQQMNLAKKTMAENKRQFDMNWGAQ